MATQECTEIRSREGIPELHSNPKIPFLSLIPKLPLGFLNWGRGGGGRVDVVVAKEEPTMETKVAEGEDSRSLVIPNVVSFRFLQPEVEPLKIESVDTEHDSNPLVLWQVYALGGFILVKWAWSNWQERQADAEKKAAESDDKSPTED